MILKNLTAKVPGKIILFGEHAVVYGHPAIAIAVDLNSYCSIESVSAETKQNDKNPISFNSPVPKKSLLIFENYGSKFEIYPEIEKTLSQNTDFKQFDFILRHFINQYNVKFITNIENDNSVKYTPIKIIIRSEIPTQSGLGSSASTSIALIYAISQYFSIKLSREDISEIAYLAEKFVHGTPSGIDNSTCTYGNAVLFSSKMDSDGNRIKNMEIIQIGNIPNINKHQFILVNSGVQKKTKRAIELIREQKEKDPNRVNSILSEIHDITEKGKEALLKGDFVKLGELMNKNHEYLKQLRISIDHIEEIRKISLENKAMGAKLTGGGLGGFVIILATVESVDNIVLNLVEKGYKTYKASFNSVGIKILKS